MSSPRLAVLALALSVSGCAPALAATSWNPVVREGVCTVRMERYDGAGRFEEVRTLDRRGRLLSTRFRLRYHGVALENRFYDARGRLRTVLLNEEIAAEDIGCEVVGGCAVPARRIVEQTDVSWDGGQPTGLARRRHEYRRDGERFVHHRGESHESAFAWDERGRLARVDRARLEYDEHGRLSRAIHSGGARVDVLSYRGGRLATARRLGCDPSGSCEPRLEQRYEYDGVGRVVRRESSAPEGVPVVEEWTWEHDRIVHWVRVEGERGAQQERAFTYDERGRLASWSSHGGQVGGDVTYEGGCDVDPVSELWTRPPEPLRTIGARACIPSHAGPVCFPSEASNEYPSTVHLHLLQAWPGARFGPG